MEGVKLTCHLVSTRAAKGFVARYHYAPVCPPITKFALGFFRDEELVGVAVWGLGVRPRHTIQSLFPSLGTGDYLELNRLCVIDDMPRNSESQFISLCANWIRQHCLAIKLLFSWADGLRGKPGYVYQAANWLYGGFIKSQFYLSHDGEVIHPRLLITRFGHRDRETQRALGLSKIHGFQFRYVHFLCGHRERKRLLAESSVPWTQQYPKAEDLRFWKQEAGEVSRAIRQVPSLKGTGQFRNPAPLIPITP